MLADALCESSQRNAGSARFQRAASNPTWVCTSRDGTMIYSISEDDKLNAGSTLLVQFVPGISMESTTAVRLPVSEHLRTQQVAWIRVTIELNQDETHAFVSNYTSGSIAMFGVRQIDP